MTENRCFPSPQQTSARRAKTAKTLDSPGLGRLPVLSLSAYATISGRSLLRAGARTDQLALELGQAAQDGQHQAAVGRGGVGPGIAQGPEPGLAAGDRRQGVEKIAGGASQPVQPGHHQHVAGRQVTERPA